MKKGFTVVELVVSFVLVSVVSIILFNLIIALKELYVNADIKTSLLNKQGIMTKKIYTDLNNKTLYSIKACGVSCLTFEYSDKSVELLLDVAGGTIKYDDYLLKLDSGANIVSLDNNHVYFKVIDDTLYLNIPVKTNFLDDDFGIHIVKKLSGVDVNVDINYKDAKIIANEIPINISKITFNNTDFNNNLTHEPEYTKINGYALFAKIFHQNRLDSDGNIVKYDSFDEFIKNKNEFKYSTLKSLETFRSFDKVDDLVNEIINKDKNLTIDKVKTSYKNGYFELILDYPGYNNSGELENYNWFSQTSNFINNNTLENSINFDTVYSGLSNGKWISGLKLLDNARSFVTGTGSGNYFTIGSKNGYELVGPDNEKINEVNLWIRVDEYISKYSLVNVIVD